MDLQLPMQSVHITTKVVSLNPAHGEVCSIQHYVIKFISDFTNKTDNHDIAEILLKVALNTKTLTLKHHSANVGFLITGTMLEGILRKRKIIMEKNNNKIQILIRKIINANNMNSYKKLYIILMNISTMLKDVFQFFKGYSINNSITNCCLSMVKSKVIV